MAIDYKFLADKPEAVPTIARWYFDEWGLFPYDTICQRINGMLNRDKIPVHFLAVDGETVIGVAQLKIREMDIYPDKEHWLGGVFVPPEHRKKGVATELLKRTLELAKKLRVTTLYLQTERLDGGIYATLGWRPIEKVNYNNRNVLVMEKRLG